MRTTTAAEKDSDAADDKGHTAVRQPAADTAQQGIFEETSDALVEDIRARLFTAGIKLFASFRLAARATRPLGIALSSLRGMALTGVLSFSVRLLIPIAVTAVAGQWTGVPWWRWAVIAVLAGVVDAGAIHKYASARMSRQQQAFTALIPRIVRKSDLRELADFVRRWLRPLVSTAVSVIVAVGIALMCLLWASAGVTELPIGSLALLAVILYEVGEVAFRSLWSSLLMARESRYDHELFWLNPMESVEVRQELRTWAATEFDRGLAITFSLVLAAILVPLDSPVILPLTAGIVVMGYLTTLVSMILVRSSVRTIVTGVQARNLASLQHSIDSFGPRLDKLSSQEYERVERLITLHDMIRNASVSPLRTRTLAHAALGLVIPTAVFALTVFSEVYAERFLDRILP